jgi:hypothetical protein
VRAVRYTSWAQKSCARARDSLVIKLYHKLACLWTSGAACFCNEQNFYPEPAMTVAIGNQSCSNVVIDEAGPLRRFTCSAPKGPGIGDVQLRVRVDNGGTATNRFLYDPPSISSVSPSPCQSNATCLVTITGLNLGLRNPATAPDPVVYIGKCTVRQTR